VFLTAAIEPVGGQKGNWCGLFFHKIASVMHWIKQSFSNGHLNRESGAQA